MDLWLLEHVRLMFVNDRFYSDDMQTIAQTAGNRVWGPRTGPDCYQENRLCFS